MTTDNPIHVGVLLYPNFELLDVFGPLEMFSSLGHARARIHMIAAQPGPIASAMALDGPLGPRVLADFGYQDTPPLDVLLVPGGLGTVAALADEALLDFIRERATATPILASVCTGSALLAKAGVLDGHRATSNKQIFDLARGQSDRVEWIEAARWVDDGRVVTSSGVSAGIDMTLALIERLLGPEAAERVAVTTEYSRHRDADQDPFVAHLNELSGLVSDSTP
jgi:transcriptional regulator GlxA family with amidase domain